MIPPVEITTDVDLPADEAFTLFTEGIFSWWPYDTHSVGQENVAEVCFDVRVGGEISEVGRDGSRHVWGTVIELDRPRRILYTWHPGHDASATQTVEVTFTSAGEGTRVRLVHSGWENAEEREGYLQGWAFVFGERYRNAALARPAAPISPS